MNNFYFLHLQNSTSNTADWELNYQQFTAWLSTLEKALLPFPKPLKQHYNQQSVLLYWDTSIALEALLKTLSTLPNTKIALDQGLAIYDELRQYYYSPTPALLPALLQVGQHYEEKIVLGEAASSVLPKEQLSYLTRSYLAGATTALEVYAWREA